MRDVLVPLEVDMALPPGGSTFYSTAGTSMGTGWSARLMLPPGADGAALTLALQRELDEIVAQMSHWEPDSLLSRYNHAPAGSWHALPLQFFEVADYALRVHEDSGGAYDPAGGQLVNLWGFGATRRYDQAGFYAPDAAAIGAVLAQRGASQPMLDRAARRLLQPGGALLDFSSVAKGYAVDCMARCLEQRSVRHYVVEAGGELRGAGAKASGEPWWVEIEGVPDADAATTQAVVALHGLAIATSGDYRRYFQHGARRAAHTLDPRSGYPVANGVASVTVLAPTCMAADALSTALTVLGPDDGLAFAEARGIAARFLVRAPGGLVDTTSSNWRALLQ
ncbi:FAD:protein FMN transferase [Massilia sp. CFBP9026]|uniref:FAD:protein FMN transferase n=1 Tax=Massilia sp. CFBP9026 TaxID=3096536 RepID=UPI002A6A1A0B|nr:FAD:protein FMN transferase [Massilia sp. CFBP9026]MDY0963679.1 FAD:protein FMN transferase [Massilia sp. CFBP9026]